MIPRILTIIRLGFGRHVRSLWFTQINGRSSWSRRIEKAPVPQYPSSPVWFFASKRCRSRYQSTNWYDLSTSWYPISKYQPTDNSYHTLSIISSIVDKVCFIGDRKMMIDQQNCCNNWWFHQPNLGPSHLEKNIFLSNANQRKMRTHDWEEMVD